MVHFPYFETIYSLKYLNSFSRTSFQISNKLKIPAQYRIFIFALFWEQK